MSLDNYVKEQEGYSQNHLIDYLFPLKRLYRPDAFNYHG